MEFQIAVRELNEMLKRTGNKNQELGESIRYRNAESRTKVPISKFRKGELKILFKVVEERLKAVPTDCDSKWLRNKLKAYFDLAEGAVTPETAVKKLEDLTIALKRFLEENSARRWLFREEEDGMLLPYFVDDIEYTKRRRDRNGEIYPAYVTVRCMAYRNGHRVTETGVWHEDKFTTRTVTELLKEKGFVLETASAVDDYKRDLGNYGKLQDACGLQMYAIGEADIMTENRWGKGWKNSSMVRDGRPTRVVVDLLTPELVDRKGDSMRFSECDFWGEIQDRNGLTIDDAEEIEDEDGDEEEKGISTTTVMLPLHPYLYCFDLEKHEWVNIHSANLQDYPWDKDLLQKLILPDEQKKLLKILISTTHGQVGDIVRGKMSGVIVLATGKPGTGKTLTAEVFSEFIEKPLYTVQCSQLGLDISTIEGNLQEILGRASRWGAVLLIDEADVYIRQRGEDIEQNAIVGIFLRLLEYYRGVLFMTSNRGNIVDDAILSRATAWVKYELPKSRLLMEIWQVLSKQYGVELAESDIRCLVRDLPTLSGRSVRNILKLASLLHGKKATAQTCIEVSKYQAIENADE